MISTSAAVLLVISMPAGAFGSNSTAIAPGAGVSASDYRFQLVSPTPNTYVTFAKNFYGDSFFVYGDHVNFTNSTVGSAANPPQNYGIGSPNSNLTVMLINSSAVAVQMQCPNAKTCNTFFYYTVDSVYLVQIDQGSPGVTRIKYNYYYSNFSNFANATAPAVYKNTTGKYLETKVAFSTPTIETFLIKPAAPIPEFSEISTLVLTVSIVTVIASLKFRIKL